VRQELKKEADKQAADRKEDHIDLALSSSMAAATIDRRFSYEPMLSGHVKKDLKLDQEVAKKQLKYPIWVSSMTGGTEKAKKINYNLAQLCGELGLGMGLGSCRQLLYEEKRVHEFDVRSLMPDNPLMINLGIAQVEELIAKKETNRIKNLISKLKADGLIIHINPLQEWMQPEGDRIMIPPIETVSTLLAEVDYPVIIKEVGQGFGSASIAALLQLPLEAIELAGYGGTNFSKIELLRSDPSRVECYEPIYNLGHDCNQMLGYINDFVKNDPDKVKTKLIIFSGGIKGFLDGYYFTQKCLLPSIYAQASGFLKHAMDYKQLKRYAEMQIEGLQMSHALLRLNP